MTGNLQPRSPFRWFFDVALLILGGAVALHLAVGLIQDVWAWILIGLALTTVVTGTVALIKKRRNRW